MRRNLVIVRAGDTSLHEAWLKGKAAERNWDLIVNYFGDDPDKFRALDVERTDSKGPKWPALYDLIKAKSDQIAAYDYVWLPDDDLETDLDNINTLFDFCHRYDLVLAQTALVPESHISHFITMRNRAFAIRFTNFVEIMAPCFRREFLMECLPDFAATKSGWGYDFVWPQRIKEQSKIAIVDAAVVRHTRPVGGANYAHLKKSVVSAFEEMDQVFEEEKVERYKPLVLGGVDPQGNILSLEKDHTNLILHLLVGALPEIAQFPQLAVELLAPDLMTLRPAGGEN
jgi:hypothetical protein